MALASVLLYSKVLRQEMPVTLVFPDPQEPPRALLWLYHGGNGDHTVWQRMTMIEQHALERRIAAVMPGVHQSCFTNMYAGGAYGDYVAQELPEQIERLFPFLPRDRERTLISGLSNGAYGALRVGMKCPQRFRAIGAFSAGDKAGPAPNYPQDPRQLERYLLFGPNDTTHTDHSARYLAGLLAEKETARPTVFHACGSDDPYLAGNLKLKAFFESFPNDPFGYVYRQYDGCAHDWFFWDRAIRDFLDAQGYAPIARKYM